MTTLADPAARAAPTSRAAEIDIARALGIVLVVGGHAVIGVERALGETPSGRFTIILIYAVHMPLFFFLSGLLARATLAAPARDFAKRLLARLAWPYLLWSLVLLGFHHAFGDLTNTRVEAPNPLRILWAPPSVMWFLYVLAASLCLARALRRARPAVTRSFGVTLIAAGLTLDAWLLPYLRFTGILLIATTLDLHHVRAAVTRRAPLATAVLCLSAGAIFAAAAAFTPLTGYPAAEFRYLPAAAGGIILTLAAATALARTPLARPFASLGQRTMPIFLTHVLVLAALRIVLLHAGVTDPAVLLALIVPAAIVLPFAAAGAADRFGAARFLGWSP